jgi:AcrR family transcriptional regulator
VLHSVRLEIARTCANPPTDIPPVPNAKTLPSLNGSKKLSRGPNADSFVGMGKRRQKLTNSEHREKSVADVLSAAEFLFVTRGYNGTTTERIGELAGLTKGSVYFYFKNKEGVLLELLHRVRENVLVPYVERLRDTRLSPAERIDAFLEYSGRIAAEQPGSMLLPIVVSIEHAGTNSEAEKRVKAGYNRVAKEVERVIQLGQSSAAFRSDLNSKDLARFLIATTDGIMLECLRQNLRVHVDQLVHTVQAMVLSGLGRAVRKKTKHKLADGPSVLELLRQRLPKR